MFSFSSPIRPQQPHEAFSPPTPLTPRSPNIQSFAQMSAPKPFFSSPPTTPGPLPQTSKSPFPFDFADLQPSHRRTDPRIPERRLQSRNPLQRSTKDRHDARRHNFLDGVKAKREEGKWDLRVDQISREKFLREQREWEAWNAAEAEMIQVEEEHEMEVSQKAVYGWQRSQGGRAGQPHDRDGEQEIAGNGMDGYQDIEGEADAVAQAEREEMEALIAMQEQAQALSPVYGSEDEDMDEAMMELVDHRGAGQDVDMS